MINCNHYQIAVVLKKQIIHICTTSLIIYYDSATATHDVIVCSSFTYNEHLLSFSLNLVTLFLFKMTVFQILNSPCHICFHLMCRSGPASLSRQSNILSYVTPNNVEPHLCVIDGPCDGYGHNINVRLTAR